MDRSTQLEKCKAISLATRAWKYEQEEGAHDVEQQSGLIMAVPSPFDVRHIILAVYYWNARDGEKYLCDWVWSECEDAEWRFAQEFPVDLDDAAALTHPVMALPLVGFMAKGEKLSNWYSTDKPEEATWEVQFHHLVTNELVEEYRKRFPEVHVDTAAEVEAEFKAISLS